MVVLGSKKSEYMSGTKQRIITGLIFAAIVIGGMLAHQWSFIGVFGLISALCLWEFLGMTLENNSSSIDALRKVLGVLLGVGVFVSTSFSDISFSFYIIFFASFLFLLFELFTASKQPFANVAYIIFGALYLGVPFGLLVHFSGELFSPFIVLGVLLIVWASDVAAYFVGKNLGKHKLFPRISPKKTWEGVFGGVGGALLVSALIWGLYQQLGWATNLTLSNWLVLGIITSVMGILGDLVESMLKRSVQIKDSGNLLPGHGGFLDRFDAFVFVIPFAALYLFFVA